MRKGKAFTRITTGLVAVAFAAACGGGDAPDAGAGDAATPAPPSGASAPTTSTPAPTTGNTSATAPAGGDAAAPAAGGASDAQLVAQGQQAYSSSICVSCHGPTANGTPLGPALNDGEWLWIEEGEDLHTQVATIIRTGVSQPRDPAHVAPMLPYGGAGQMSDDQVNALAAYIVSLN